MIPLAASPVVWDGHVRRTVRAVVLVALLWALAVAMLGFFSPFHLAHALDEPGLFIPALLCVVGVLGALALGPEIGADFKHVMGYGFLKPGPAVHSRTVAPHRARRLSYAAVLCGLLLGCLAAAVIRVASADALEALLLGVVAVLLLIPTRRMFRRARITWRQALHGRVLLTHMIDDGDHAVGRVRSVRSERQWVDGKALFHVELAYDAGGRDHAVVIRLLSYPLWAPAVGNEFDVWTDPERPFDQDRTVLERRYVGQVFADFASEPARLEHVPSAIIAAGMAAAVDDKPGAGPGALDAAAVPRGAVPRAAPSWLPQRNGGMRPVSARRARETRVLLGLPPVVIAAVAVAGVVLVPVMISAVPWWTLAALWLYAVLTVINAFVYWQFMRRSRWFIRAGISFGATESAVFAGFFAAGFCVLSTPSMVGAPVNGDAPWTLAHVLVGVALLGALLVFEWAFSSTAWALNHLNTEFPAPAVVIQEALTGHDPAGIDRLEVDYGYRAGVLLCG